MNSGAENFCVLKTVKFFFPNLWQMMTFLNPLDALIPKIPFSFFAHFLGLGHFRGLGVSLSRILGFPSIEPLFGGHGALSPPPSN